MDIKFHLRDKSHANSSVNVIIHYKGNRFKLSTGIKVITSKWNPKSMRVNTKGYPDSDLINIQIDSIESDYLNLFNSYTIERVIPSLEKVKQDYARIRSEAIVATGYTPAGISPTASNQTNLSKSLLLADDDKLFLPFLVKYVNDSNYKTETRKKYRTTANWITKFEKKLGIQLSFDDIDLDFYDQFQQFVTSKTYKPSKNSEPRQYSLNYFGSLIKCIKHVMREAGPDGRYNLHNSNSYKNKAFKVGHETADTIYLNMNELIRIHQFVPTVHNISEVVSDPRVEQRLRAINAYKLAKNKFLIGAFTGLRVSDFNRLEEVNIRDSFIRIKPRKGTGKNEDVVIPIHPIVKEILQSGFDIATPISDQHINENIKKVCRLVGINENVVIHRTEGGKLIERKYKKWQLVCTHTARRSGATNMYIAGIPSISIMKITGHKTEKSFLKYIKISQEENARLLADHRFFQ